MPGIPAPEGMRPLVNGSPPSDRSAGPPALPGPPGGPALEPPRFPRWIPEWLILCHAAGPDRPVADAVRAILGREVLRILEQESAVARGEVEGIHRMRQGLRRLRSGIQLFGPVLDPIWSEAGRAELRQLSQRLGEVRDLDVMSEGLTALAADSKLRVRRLLEPIRLRRAVGCQTLGVLLSDRDRGPLLRRLSPIFTAPALLPSAEDRCGDRLPELTHRLWHRISRAGQALEQHATDDALHDLRKRAKELRTAAELIGPWVDAEERRHAKRLARRTSRLLGPLGRHQDAIVALAYLREPNRPPEAAMLRLRLESQVTLGREDGLRAWRKLRRDRYRGRG